MKLSVVIGTLYLTWLALVVQAEERKVVCYFGSWAVYRHGNGKIEISDLDPTLCTHMIYTFVGITDDGEIRVLDPYNDLADNWGKAGFKNFNALRSKSVGTKTLVAIGGWNEGSIRYSKVMADASLRSKFVNNAVDFVLEHGFDGFDVDWEYPNQRGGVPADIWNFVLLLKELRAKFDEHGLILSAAVGAAEISASKSYDIPQISKYLHFINLMTYDFHGSWDSLTGHNAPLYSSARDNTAATQSLNVNATVHYWLAQGAPAEKLVLGTGLYGRSFTLANSANNAPGSESSGAGLGGPYTQENGMLGYNEICEAQSSWTSVWDEEQHVPYAFKDNQWVSYDDVKSITEKAEFAKSLGLGGAMVWSIETDDFRGICGEPYPLLRALNSVLRDASSSSSEPKTSTTPNSDASTSPQTPHQTTPDNSEENEVLATTERDNETNIICGGSSNYIRDPEDCAKFWVCQPTDDNDLKPVSFTCAEGLYFDTNLLVCNYKDLVDC